MATHTKQTRDEVRRLYIEEGYSLNYIADTLNIAYPTVHRWKKRAFAIGDDWEKQKAKIGIAKSETIARSIMFQLMIAYEKSLIALDSDEFSAIDKARTLASLSESFARSINANQKLMPELNDLEVTKFVLDELIVFIRLNNPDLLEVFANMLELFAKTIDKKLINFNKV